MWNFSPAQSRWLELASDGYGNAGVSVLSCDQPYAHVASNTDCNDLDNSIYPGAPGTALGVDNNCNMVIDPEEELPTNPCIGDFNDDGVINTSDLLLFMSYFGCTSSCAPYDFTGDGVVNISDLLLFMSVFGTYCPWERFEKSFFNKPAVFSKPRRFFYCRNSCIFSLNSGNEFRLRCVPRAIVVMWIFLPLCSALRKSFSADE